MQTVDIGHIPGGLPLCQHPVLHCAGSQGGGGGPAEEPGGGQAGPDGPQSGVQVQADNTLCYLAPQEPLGEGDLLRGFPEDGGERRRQSGSGLNVTQAPSSSSWSCTCSI